MKKNIGLLLTPALLFAACLGSYGQTNSAGYLITGTINGVSKGKVKLISYNQDDRTSKVIDSAGFKNGRFEIHGKTDAPQMVTVTIEPGNWSFPIFLENKPLEVTADTTGATYYDYSMYGGAKGATIKNYTESGSQNFIDWMAYQNNPGQKNTIPSSLNLVRKFRQRKILMNNTVTVIKWIQYGACLTSGRKVR